MANILKTDIDAWYTQLNASRVRLGLGTITAPTITPGNPTLIADVSTLKSEFATMSVDTYFQYATYSDVSGVTTGVKTLASQKTAFQNTLNSVDATIICRNNATNAYGLNTNGTNTNGSHPNGTCNNGTCSQGTMSLTLQTYSTNTNGACSNGACTN